MMLEKCCIAMLTSITSSVPALPLIMIHLTTTVNVLIAVNWNIEIPFRSVC